MTGEELCFLSLKVLREYRRALPSGSKGNYYGIEGIARVVDQCTHGKRIKKSGT